MRVYTVITDEYEGLILAIAADTAKEARVIAYQSGDCDLNWIDIKTEWHKGVDTTGLDKGVIPIIRGLELGLYGGAEMPCPKCGNDARVSLHDDKSVSCMKCYEDRAIIQQLLQPDILTDAG